MRRSSRLGYFCGVGGDSRHRSMVSNGSKHRGWNGGGICWSVVSEGAKSWSLNTSPLTDQMPVFGKQFMAISVVATWPGFVS